MNFFLQFLVIFTIIVLASIFGGMKIVSYIRHKESDKALNNLIYGAMLILGGFFLSSGYYYYILSLDNPDKQEVVE